MRVVEVTVFCLIAFLFCLPARAVEQDAWFCMCSALPYGRFKVTTTYDTIMADNGVFKYSISAKRPDVVAVINGENNSYIETTVARYSQQWAPSLPFPKLSPGQKRKILGFDCQQYSGKLPGGSVEGWYTKGVVVDSKILNAICRLCAVPVGYGMPVKVDVFDAGGKHALFELIKAKKAKSDSAQLAVPKSYRLVTDQAEFYFADMDGKNASADELFRSVPMKPKRK